MEKGAGKRWRYFGVYPQALYDSTVDGGLCRRCHEEGVADSLFGLPRSLAEPIVKP